MSVQWKTDETSRKLGTRSVVDSVSGKKKIEIIKDTVKFEYPEISAETPEQFSASMGELINRGVYGFKSWAQVLAHLNYGLKRSIAVAFNSGQDATLTPAQRQLVKLYAGIVRLGGMALSDAAKQLQAQGVDNAMAVLEAFDPDTEENTAN
jgi:hypothetical protein